MDKQTNKVASKNKVTSSETFLKPQTSNSDNVKSLASISLDLDNLWSYMKSHGDPGWESFPTYLETFIPMVLDTLDDLNLKITFFIVGQDAALEKNRNVLKLITESGHEVGNHSFSHEPWLHLHSKDRIKREILLTEKSVQQVTNQKPIGFRGPGFSWCRDLFEILLENGYIYDASTLPTYLGPLARMYYFWTSNLTENEKNQRKELFGGFQNGKRPVKPYYWKLPSGERLSEMPVTTMPIFKTPFHLSYLLYISQFSKIIMSFYLNVAIFLCKTTKTEPSFLLHPLDFLGGDQVPELAFFPGMGLTGEHKFAIFNKVIRMLAKHYKILNMSTHAESIFKRGNLQEIRL